MKVVWLITSEVKYFQIVVFRYYQRVETLNDECDYNDSEKRNARVWVGLIWSKNCCRQTLV